jgi:L-arabonate dehydrase
MFIKPTTMLLRNLMAMDVEEMIRTQPLDGVVRLGGCDKTTPAQIMGAGLPAIVCSGGPMLHGQWHDRKLGAGTDGRKLFDLFRKGDITGEQWCEIEGGIARSAGHCNVMGTASTMTLLAEALGLALPATAAIPAPDSRRLAAAEECGRRIVELVRDDLTPAKILTPVESAVGGPLAAVQTGDEIELDASARRLHLHVPEEEISRRLKSFQPPPPHYTRGYGRLFLDHVLQADEGWDFDFLRGI